MFFCLVVRLGLGEEHSALRVGPINGLGVSLRWERGDGALEWSLFDVRLSSHFNFTVVDKCIGADVNLPEDYFKEGGWALSGAFIPV